MNAVQWFQDEFPHVLGFHVPNGEKRDRRTAELLKRMGVLAGVGDWLFFPQPRVMVCIEFKKPKDSEQHGGQERFERQWKAIGGSYHVVRDLEAFQALCIGYCASVERAAIVNEIREAITVPWG